MTEPALPLALTMGDPAGIGPELTAKLWKLRHHIRAGQKTVFFWIGDPALIAPSIPVQVIGSPFEAMECFDRALPVLPVACNVDVVAGRPDPRNAASVIRSIEHAVQLVLVGEAGGVVTNPLAKHILARSGFTHPGHTEFLAELCGVSGQEVMMLASPQLRVVLTSIHIPLKQAIATLSTQRIIEVALCTAQSLRWDFGLKQPRLALAGLNPHAGENGLMGQEEEEIIRPAVTALQEKGVTICGPLSPDTMFSSVMRPRYDAAICLYHDQGLIPLKTLDMEQGVNVTLGLPIIRTSPDHGTAFDIAGQNRASPASLMAAMAMAAEMAQHRGETSHIAGSQDRRKL